MPEPASQSPPASLDPPGGPVPLPSITSQLSAIELVSRLDAAARRGKLPGFHKASGDLLFTITDFGHPCESVLEARATPQGSGCEVRFRIRLKPALPWLLTILMVLTVWPGIWLTDSMLSTYFSGYSAYWLKTWMWYLPLTVPFVPLTIWQTIRRSRTSARAQAVDLLAKIRAAIGPDSAAP